MVWVMAMCYGYWRYYQLVVKSPTGILIVKLRKLAGNNFNLEEKNIKQKTQTYLMAQMVKRLPTMWQIWARSLHQDDPLKKEMATHSSTFSWKIPSMEEPRRLQSIALQRVRNN